jgi:hypothetical protein
MNGVRPVDSRFPEASQVRFANAELGPGSLTAVASLRLL